MAATIPRLVVLKSKDPAPNDGIVYYNDDGSIIVGEESVFSTAVKIEVERAKSNANYIHLRFCYSNRYWARKSDDNRFLVAESKQPEEDTKNPACTLFEPSVQAGAFYLTHVESGGRVLIDEATSALYLGDGFGGFLEFEDWDALVKLPARVAFMGDNGKYLQALTKDGLNYLQFAATDSHDSLSGHQVQLMPDGHVRILSDYFNFFWRRRPAGDWIQADSPADGGAQSLFWPVKIDDNTVALQNARNDNFCKRFTADGITDCLAATVPTLTSQARFRVQELVLRRNITDVRFREADARVYDEMPSVAGEIPVTNEGDVEATLAVSITYQDSRSYTFGRSSSLSAGVPTTIEVGVPFIEKGGLKVSYETKGLSLQWNTATTTATTLTALGVVSVPARSTAIVEFVGTRATCDVPFSYTQEDQIAADAKPVSTLQADGIYTAVNSYDFHFQIKSVDPIPAWTWT